jgi:predicted GNAT family acetyltransferase
MATTVVRNEERSRYELWQDDRMVGLMDFVERGDTAYLVHTEIAPELRGQGRGDILVGRALDDLRARGAHYVGTCWFVEDFVARHPEYAPSR